MDIKKENSNVNDYITSKREKGEKFKIKNSN